MPQKFFSKWVCLTIALLGISSTVSALDIQGPGFKKFITQVQKQAPQMPGYAIAIVVKGEVVYQAVGGSTKPGGPAITAQTLFPLASGSKPVCATLVPRQQLSFDQAISVPALRTSFPLAQILSHTTGCHESGNLGIEAGDSRDKILAGSGCQKDLTPGVFYYSNIIYSLLQDALEQGGTPMATQLAGLAADLGVSGQIVLGAGTTTAITYPHIQTKKGQWQALVSPPYYPKVAPAAAGVYASLEGMVAFLKLHLGHAPEVLSKDELAPLHQAVVEATDTAKFEFKWPYAASKLLHGYGHGWRTLQFKDNPATRLVYHGGFLRGVTMFVGFMPEQDVGIVILTNAARHFALYTGLRFWSLVLNELGIQPVTQLKERKKNVSS